MLKLDPMLKGTGVSDSPGDVQGGVQWEYLGCPLPGLYSMYWHLHSTWQYMTYLGKSSQNYPGGRGAFRHFFVHHCVHQCWQISCLSFLFWLWLHFSVQFSTFVFDLKYHLLKSSALPHYLYMSHTCWTYSKICENTAANIFDQYILLWFFTGYTFSDVSI